MAMNYSNNNFCSGGQTNSNCVISKLRRLKIQESILTTNVTKCHLQNYIENDEYTKPNNDIQFNKYISKLKDSFIEIKNLFDDIKVKTNNEDHLDQTDIDELKKDILDLEFKIRTLKQFTINELQILQNEELRIAKKDDTLEISTPQKKHTMARSSGQLKEYKEIIPSPVRAMINSPLKCSEVQQFQDFMKNSPSRYGGWNEYSHNIFVQIWNKYYGHSMGFEFKSIQDTYSYQNFKEEILHKIPGSKLDSIDSHSKWYSEYLYFKMKQQMALNRWKENKRKMKPTQRIRQTQYKDSIINELKYSYNTELSRQQNQMNFVNTQSDENFIGESSQKSLSTIKDGKIDKNKIDIVRLQQPTKQWISKCDSKHAFEFIKNVDVDTINKLRIPTWRQNLFK